MECKEKLEEYLREAGVQFVFHHHPVAYTAQEVAAKEHVPGRMLAKAVMVLADGELVMVVVPAPEKVDVAKVAMAMGATETRIATEAEFSEAFPDCDVGAMPVFGNLYDVPVLVDEAMAENETIVSQAGTHTDTITVNYSDFRRLVRPTLADLVRRP